MVIVIDSQEKAPWFFGAEQRTIRRSLDTGDYSIQSYESLITVERKSLNDLVHTVIHDWRRFTHELRRMAAMDVAAIVVEADVRLLMGKQYDSDAEPNAVRGKLNSIFVDYGIPTMFFPDRTIAAEWVLNLFAMYWDRKQ